MAPSIWTAEERELLAEYLEPYKARDEDQRILLLENKVIPKFLALFPPPRPADTGGTKNDDREMYERQRLVRQVCVNSALSCSPLTTIQRIRTWFVKKVPTNVSHTPRRNPRARGDPDEREVLKHHIENYRIAGDKLRKILVATQVLPDYVRHFAPVTEVYKLSQKQRKRYRKVSESCCLFEPAMLILQPTACQRLAHNRSLLSRAGMDMYPLTHSCRCLIAHSTGRTRSRGGSTSEHRSYD